LIATDVSEELAVSKLFSDADGGNSEKLVNMCPLHGIAGLSDFVHHPDSK
jgi:hypothetical protein